MEKRQYTEVGGKLLILAAHKFAHHIFHVAFLPAYRVVELAQVGVGDFFGRGVRNLVHFPLVIQVNPHGEQLSPEEAHGGRIAGTPRQLFREPALALDRIVVREQAGGPRVPS